jgi:3-oxoacyl-[acyl-carrier protein] reductase
VPENKVSYAGQVVVITGAARGIGAATARLVTERGGKVFALDIARDGLTALQKELSLPDNQVATIDLGSQTSVKENIDAIYKITGRIDALINTAGVVGPTNVKVEDVKWEDFESTVWLTQAVVPYMKKAKYGRIAHVASIAGKEGNPGMTPYNVSKSGMIGFVKGVAKEIAPDGITINSLAPAVIRTPMNADTSDETLKYMISRIPMGRVGEAEEVAEILAFMGSSACSFTTGFTFDASGGRATY